MEIELTRIHLDANVYDVRKAVEEVLHGHDLYDPNNPDNKGRKPNFEVLTGESPAGRLHNGKAILRLPKKLGSRLLRWYKDTDEHRIVVNGRPLRLYKTDNPVPLDVKQVLKKALYIDPDQDKLRTQIEERARQVRLQISQVQFGVWYNPPNYKCASNTFHSTTARLAPQIYIHPRCAAIFATRDAKIENRGIATSCATMRQFKDTYLSFLHATRNTEDNVCASSLDGTDDVSSDDQEWDEEQPLVDAEMLGSP